ncbi:CaiB/BaiF CoA-transferase family protein [Oceanicola sp. 22II-s10i]|uniref:CaiB/BaiF CoA transferase family protein n=1 Tax=Oceanicola sp. 22II-s10i TaxID=1317116 RepID=UPI0020CD8062|nr:CaiB/BaiF CoA-transferase family protein [Oceanicola sp. 22II-s10i]
MPAAMKKTGPLAGIKVVEMAGLGPVPLAGQLLADMGAEVTVIDRKTFEPDPTNVNRRGKLSVALNLKSEDGRAEALDRIAAADVLMEGFRPGVMERLGLGPDACLARHPGLIYGRMTGWGQDGPMARMAGHDINYIALTGALHAMGPEDKPVPPLNLLGDYGGGTMFLMTGILAALVERATSGRGQVIDAAIVDGVPAMMGLIHQMIADGRWDIAGRERNRLDAGAPYYTCYRTRDGGHVAVGALEDAFFAILAEGLGLSRDLIDNRHDKARWPEMRATYAGIFALKTRDEWMEIFGGTDACVSPVLDFEEAERDPHMAARRVLVRRDDVLQSNAAPRFSRTQTGLDD